MIPFPSRRRFHPLGFDFIAQQCPACSGEGQDDHGDCCWQCDGSGKIPVRVKRDGIFSRAFFSRVEGAIWFVVVLLVASLIAYLILKR